jgi:hypothetical protein
MSNNGLSVVILNCSLTLTIQPYLTQKSNASFSEDIDINMETKRTSVIPNFFLQECAREQGRQDAEFCRGYC